MDNLNKVSNCKTLTDLFDCWQERQKSDEKFSNNCVFDNDKAKVNFVKDGRFVDTALGGVLFICKESNLESDTNFGEKEFWMKKVIEEKNDKATVINDNPKIKSIKSHYYNCFTLLLNRINELHNTDYNIFDCAYINLNKRGGRSVANNNKILRYILDYQEEILKEIELIGCEIIVICSYNSLFNTKEIQEILSKVKENHTVYAYIKHPSRYTKKAIEDINEPI